MNKGIHHIGLATCNMDDTINFYVEKLGFKIVRYDNALVNGGGNMRHVFLDCGHDQMISFLSPENIPAVPKWDCSINGGLGVPRGFYHFAFQSESEAELEDRQKELVGKGVEVSPVIDHDWCKSIYFDDPVNGISLEFCAMSRVPNEDDRTMSVRANVPLGNYNYESAAMKMAEADKMKILEERGLR